MLDARQRETVVSLMNERSRSKLDMEAEIAKGLDFIALVSKLSSYSAEGAAISGAELAVQDHPPSEELNSRLQIAVRELVNVMLALGANNEPESKVLLRDELIFAQSQSPIIRECLIEFVSDAMDSSFLNNHLQALIEGQQAEYTQQSPFRVAVLKVVAECKSALHNRKGFEEFAGVVERRGQCFKLEKASQPIRFPKEDAKEGYDFAYPDDDLVKEVESILIHGKKFGISVWLFEIDRGFNSFLDKLHTLNENRKSGKLQASTQTPFGAEKNKLHLIKVLLLALEQRAKLLDKQIYTQKVESYSSQLFTQTTIQLLRDQINDLQRTLECAKTQGFIPEDRKNGDQQWDASDQPQQFSAETYKPTKSGTETLQAEITALWDKMGELNYLTFEKALADQAMLPLLEKENTKLRSANRTLLLQLGDTQSEAKSALEFMSRNHAADMERQRLAYEAELEESQELLVTYKRELTKQGLGYGALLEKLNTTLGKHGGEKQEKLSYPVAD
jgi:hypothetical protein